MDVEACNIPWIGAVVDSYASELIRYRQANDFTYCCDTTGRCTSEFPTPPAKCGLGYMRCIVGNSKFVCKFTYQDGSNKQCYHEGSLTKKRNFECCPSKLTNFLTSQKCMSGYTFPARSLACCNESLGCDWYTMCMGSKFDDYMCLGGKTTAVCYGPPVTPITELPEDPLKMKCIQEVSLGAEDPRYIKCLNIEGVGSAGTCSSQSGNQTQPGVQTEITTTTAATMTTRTTTTSTTKANPTGDFTNVEERGQGNGAERGTKAQRWAAVCLVVPVLVQMLIL